VDAEYFGSAQQVSVAPANDFGYEALFELPGGFVKQDPMIDHVDADRVKPIFEAQRILCW
jgi:hypothetical protein